MQEIEENKQEVVEITPIKKGRRILLFLADFFINFILCFVLFNAVIMPLIQHQEKIEMMKQREYSLISYMILR